MRVRVASAGTGKTTSLVLRYLELIASETPLRRIAGVTFTRTAAAELRQRVAGAIRELLSQGEYLGTLRLSNEQRPAFEEALRELDGATLTTIHGFMVDALRLAAPAMGLDPDFSPAPEWEAQALFEEELRSLLFLARDPVHPLNQAARKLAATGSGKQAENQLLTLFGKRSLVESFEAGDGERSQALVELFAAGYWAFEQRLGPRLLPPGEIERRALRMTRVPAALARLGQRFRVVLVDEFQDVNPLQGRFFEAIEGAGPEVEVVGDPKQSIYGFRNADVGVFRRALAAGEELPPLDRSYRHGELVNRFLNKLTGTLAQKGMGFGLREAPQVTAAGSAAQVRGRIEVHWVAGEEQVSQLRATEARVLAERLESLHREFEIPYSEMAVLARSHHSLAIMEDALRSSRVPAVLLQGRGYFERTEIRDLYNALRAGIEPVGVAFAAWLRGPFGRLAPAELEAVLKDFEPEAALERVNPAAAERYRNLQELILLPPLAALKALIRDPLVEGRSFVDFLDSRQRENVDALLFTAARQPPGDLEVLLGRLELLGRQTDAGDVPQTGEGVNLLTVHAAKGLEWRVTAVFDLGRGPPPNRDTIRVDPENGEVSFPGCAAFSEAGRKLAEREEAESYRLLYVAASRPREVLLLTGSAKGGRCVGWASALELMSLGPKAKQQEGRAFLLTTHPCRPPEREPRQPSAAPRHEAEEEAEWIDDAFPHHPYPPLYSPSRLGARPREDQPKRDSSPAAEGEQSEGMPVAGYGEDAEPIRPGDPDNSADLPGRSSSVGTLVHYAISQSWLPGDRDHLENLRAQEVMFPFNRTEQEEMLSEVAELLANYWSLVGEELPALDSRQVDEAELPVALPHGPTVWQGVIDRLYQVEGQWYIDDYKTDRTVNPENYLPQLSIYWRAVKDVRGIEPVARLVYLRSRQVIDLEPRELSLAFEGAMAGSLEPTPG